MNGYLESHKPPTEKSSAARPRYSKNTLIYTAIGLFLAFCLVTALVLQFGVNSKKKTLAEREAKLAALELVLEEAEYNYERGLDAEYISQIVGERLNLYGPGVIRIVNPK